ncbi:hypothetical protein CWATWH0005_199 [Crocosphaera watsonii WH 0005]|uniref:Uncharacterized protein n=1 Tax=Crocosphaera watsonii WH 0005 TaxID=423472 RepID=T2IWN5_CROWT|nr:DUF3987 domain-containing protein [Crocosphaera watsonii]CCQ57222.1 hypothetical protein CWATWH0005_199 [Crocosphaera watsonii WH 0005]
MKFPEIDRNLAQRQLALLGHSINKPVYLRFFYPSDDPRKDGDGGRKADKINWNQIEKYQKEGRGAYLVVNGGGHKNNDVTQGHAIFYEHDDLPKELQRELWKTLGLPEPTFQVDTGGKSIHSYWVFVKAIVLDKWGELQRDLLEYVDGDRSIKNPARVMRMAGGWHISHDPDGNPIYNQTKIISASAKTYNYEELREIIPQKEERLPIVEAATYEVRSDSCNKDDSSTQSSEIRHPDFITVPVPAPVPLLQCCRKEVRELVATGVPKGCKRNDEAINVGLELIAVERYLQRLGQSYSDSAASLFHEFCVRSQMTASEEEERYQWCNKTNSDPSCPPDAIAACIRGWYWNEVIKPQKRNGKVKFDSGHTQKVKTPSSPPSTQQNQEIYEQVPEQLAIEHIDAILDKNLDEAQQDLELNKLAKQFSNFNAREIREIANKRIAEREREDNISERFTELEQIQAKENHEYVPFADLFYDSPSTQKKFEHLCRVNQKIQPQYFLSIFSPFSSVMGIKGSCDVPVLGKFRGNINISMVGESGNGKSIVSGILLDPLYRLQNERLQKYQQQERQYNQAVEQWEKQHLDERGPKPRKDEYITIRDGFLVINEYSREGIVKNHADNPNGLLIHQEELVAIQRAQNMYRQGKGDDRQFLNNLYDNKAIARSLKSERIIVEETAVSIVGGYQPDIVLSEMGDLSDPDGQWARFNFVCATEKRVYTDLSQPKIDVSDIVYNLYKKALNAAPVECHLDQVGLDLLQDYINKLEDQRWESLQPGWRAILSKASGEVVRIALNLHWMNCLINDRPVTPVIPAIAIKTAIKIKRFFLSQIDLIRKLGLANPHREDGLSAVYSQILNIAKRVAHKSKFLTVRMVQSTRSGVFKNLKSQGIEQMFKDIAAMGKAKLVKHKRSLALLIDSLLDGDEVNQDLPQSPNGTNNNSTTTTSFDETLSGISKSEPELTPVLLANVGQLLEKTELLKGSLDNNFNSFVGIVGTVGSTIPSFSSGIFTPQQLQHGQQ